MVDVAVIVVSDFEASAAKSWADEVAMAAALAAQDIGTPFEVVFVENDAHRAVPPPPALFAGLANASVLYAPQDASAALKDFAVAACARPWVAVLEADARPEADWLRLLVEAAAAHPEYDGFGGRTFYGEETAWQRCLNLLDRSFDDAGVSGPTWHLCNNGALVRTAVLRCFPYPPAPSPFLSARLRLDALHGAGHRFYFVREARTRHAVGDASFVGDFRRHTGYSDMMTAPATVCFRTARLAGSRMRVELGGAYRVGTRYLRWSDWPLWLLLFACVRWPEWRGMRAAAADPRTALDGSSYR